MTAGEFPASSANSASAWLQHAPILMSGAVVVSISSLAPAPSGRPGAARRARMEQSAEGRAALMQGRQRLGALLLQDGVLTLSALRLAKGLTQAELCSRAGLMQPQLSRLESGAHADVRHSTVERLASVLGCDLDTVSRALQAARAAREQRDDR